MPAVYRHYKGRYYQIIDEALDTQNDSIVIVYRTLYASSYSLFTRPKDLFFGQVRLADGTSVPRFTPVSPDDLPPEARKRVVSSITARDK